MDYKLLSIKPSDFKDTHGNVWCDVSFEGVSEPVKWVTKDPTKLVIGREYHGVIEEKTSKAGKAYQRFKKVQKEEYQPNQNKEDYWADKDARISAHGAVNTAVQILQLKGEKELTVGMLVEEAEKVLQVVDILVKRLEDVK